MSKEILARICISEDQPISEAVARIDASGGEIALVVDKIGRLIGTVTDGDVRRGILRGNSLETPVATIMNRNPKSAQYGMDLRVLSRELKSRSIGQMPILNDQGVVVDVIFARDLDLPLQQEHSVVIMAGGLGTRLRPITETIPKPMIRIGGKPILEVIIGKFLDQGFHKFTFCVNHLADVIRDHFSDGSKFGVEIEYIVEPKRLGTAGALSLIDPAPTRPVIVMNGDILTSVNFNQLLAFHYENRAAATMGVNRFQYTLPYGVVEVQGHSIHSFHEKPIYDFFVNSGIYVVSPEAISLIPKDDFFDMPALFEKLSDEKRVAFPIHEYWLDIGRHDDLDRAIREHSEENPKK
ncbi:UNVERIFIED_ORG: dTDP-glucose pyrophosphorylase [Shinella zoogloeoides]|jgi:dTDP-glucose pyrophosphorylase|nr:dTDP-glucose pyrophosphorylase [Shinella zoogloeoides]